MIVIMLLIYAIKAEHLFFSFKAIFHCLEILKFYLSVWEEGITEYNMNRENKFTMKLPELGNLFYSRLNVSWYCEFGSISEGSIAYNK